MTKRKKWPEEAEWARLDAIAAIRRECEALLRELNKDLPVETIRQIGRTIKNLKEAELKLIECRDK